MRTYILHSQTELTRGSIYTSHWHHWRDVEVTLFIMASLLIQTDRWSTNIYWLRVIVLQSKSKNDKIFTGVAEWWGIGSDHDSVF